MEQEKGSGLNDLRYAKECMDAAERVCTDKQGLVYEAAVESAFRVYDTLSQKHLCGRAAAVMNLTKCYDDAFHGLDSIDRGNVDKRGVYIGHSTLSRENMTITLSDYSTHRLQYDMDKDSFSACVKNICGTIQAVWELRDIMCRIDEKFDKLEGDFYGRLCIRFPEKQKGVSWEDTIRLAAGDGSISHRLERAYAAYTAFVSSHAEHILTMLSIVESAVNAGLGDELGRALDRYLDGNQIDYSFEGTPKRLAVRTEDVHMIFSGNGLYIDWPYETGAVKLPYGLDQESFSEAVLHRSINISHSLPKSLITRLPEVFATAGNIMDDIESSTIDAAEEITEPYMDLEQLEETESMEMEQN